MKSMCDVDELELPTRSSLKPIRMFDGLYPEDVDEAEAYWDFIRWYLCQDYAAILEVPEPDKTNFFVPVELDGSLSFPFSSTDFQRQLSAFNYKHWQTKKVLERVKDLAILHSVLSYNDGKQRTKIKFIKLIEKEYLDEARLIAKHIKKYSAWMNKQKAIDRVEGLNRKIKMCKRVWEKHAYEE